MWNYYSTGKIQHFTAVIWDNPNGWQDIERSVSFDKHGIIQSRQTKKAQHYFGFVGDEWKVHYGHELLSEGCLAEQEMAENNRSGEELSNNELDAAPKYKIRNIQSGKTHGVGYMQMGRKVGEWTDKPPRCRKLRTCFYVRGVRVPEKVMKNPEQLTVDEILGEENAEVKRTMLEQQGYDVFLNRCGDRLKVVDVNKDPHIGTLYHIQDPTLQEQVKDWRGNVMTDDNGDPLFNPDRIVALLKVKDGTLPKHYVLRVDPSCKTAKAANAWTWGLTPGKYAPVIER
jgi:hypothetical protein